MLTSPAHQKKFQGISDNIISDGTHHFGMKAVHVNRVVGVIYYMVGGYFIGDCARTVNMIMINVGSQVQNTMFGGKAGVPMVRSLKAWVKANKADGVLFYENLRTKPFKN